MQSETGPVTGQADAFLSLHRGALKWIAIGRRNRGRGQRPWSQNGRSDLTENENQPWAPKPSQIRSSSLLFGLTACVLLTACPGSPDYPKPEALPNADQFVEHLMTKQSAARSFQAESRMDYRVGDERIKTTVLVMGERSAKVRFNALNPDDTVAADLACDGINFAFVDFNKNCQLTGPCTSDAIASLLRVNLEPDDFLSLAIGSVPLIPNAESSAEWNPKNGTVVIKRINRDLMTRQEIILDGRKATYDVIRATVHDANNRVEWSLENKDYADVKANDGTPFRVPGKTRFQQPKSRGDLKIRWQNRTINLDLAEDKFIMVLPGLSECGAKKQ